MEKTKNKKKHPQKQTKKNPNQFRNKVSYCLPLNPRVFLPYIAEAATNCDFYCCFTAVEEVSWSYSCSAKLMLLLLSAAETAIYMHKNPAIYMHK